MQQKKGGYCCHSGHWKGFGEEHLTSEVGRAPCCWHLWEVFMTTQFNSCPGQQDSKQNNSQKTHYGGKDPACQKLNDAAAFTKAPYQTPTSISFTCAKTIWPHSFLWSPEDFLQVHWDWEVDYLLRGHSVAFPSVLTLSLSHTPLALTAAHASKAQKVKAVDSTACLADLLFCQFCRLCKGSWLFLC